MDMTKDALQYVVGLKNAEVITINGENYTDRQVSRVDRGLRADPVKMHTLTGPGSYTHLTLPTTSNV